MDKVARNSRTWDPNSSSWDGTLGEHLRGPTPREILPPTESEFYHDIYVH